MRVKKLRRRASAVRLLHVLRDVFTVFIHSSLNWAHGAGAKAGSHWTRAG